MPSVQFGDTFVIQHLWIVASDPAANSGKFIIFNITTDRSRAGTDCELTPSDHPWITEKSYVSFGDAREVSPKEELKLLELMNGGTIRKHYPLKKTVLQRIVNAAKTSRALPLRFKNYF